MQEEIVRNRRITVAAEWLACTPLLATLFRSVEGWRGFSDYLLAVIAQIARMPYEDTEARRCRVPERHFRRGDKTSQFTE